MEVMGYCRWAHAYDDYEGFQPTWYVNKTGKCYKKATMKILKIFTDGRLKVPPLGSTPGMEKFHSRFMNTFSAPLELKGLGQLVINHDNDAENYDIGFAYLPAFKRTIRVSASTYQDNVGGTDFTYGDPTGLNEPFGAWNFKLIEKKLMLLTDSIRETKPTLEAGGLGVNPQVQWDVGKRYARLGWVVNPVYIVEATPKDSGHMYSKKILYVAAPFFGVANPEEVTLADVYDRTGNLWKVYYDWRGGLWTHQDGEYYTCTTGMTMHDMQTGHQTHFINYMLENDAGMEADFFVLRTLLQLGR
jgi:hypothetical protein